MDDIETIFGNFVNFISCVECKSGEIRNDGLPWCHEKEENMSMEDYLIKRAPIGFLCKAVVMLKIRSREKNGDN